MGFHPGNGTGGSLRLDKLDGIKLMKHPNFAPVRSLTFFHPDHAIPAAPPACFPNDLRSSDKEVKSDLKIAEIKSNSDIRYAMPKNILLALIGCWVTAALTYGQSPNLDGYDIFIRDTLINKADFLQHGRTLDSSRLKYLTFKPVSDGQKHIYYLSGALYAQGEIKNKKEDGLWTYWYENGQKAREGDFIDGKRTGTHTYWYASGKLRAIGNFSNDEYDGKWTIYNEDGSGAAEATYKNGQMLKEKPGASDSTQTKHP